MLKYQLLHPELLRALGQAGHGAKVLVGDGNYPLVTQSAAAATRVYLNLTPDLVKVTDVLRALRSAVPIEACAVMRPGLDQEAPIVDEFRELLPGLALEPLERFEFYRQARSQDVALAVATADRRFYANILLTIGVARAEEEPRHS